MIAKKQSGTFVWNQNFDIIAHKEDIKEGQLELTLYEKGLSNTEIGQLEIRLLWIIDQEKGEHRLPIIEKKKIKRKRKSPYKI